MKIKAIKGQVYELDMVTHYGSIAKNRARELRKSGYSARVIVKSVKEKCKVGTRTTRRFEVWKRH